MGLPTRPPLPVIGGGTSVKGRSSTPPRRIRKARPAMTDTPTRTPTDAALERAAELARAYVATLPDRPVGATASLDELRDRFGGPLPEHGEDPVAVIEELARNAEGGLIASAGPRF